MRFRLKPTRRTRLRLALLAVVALLFQQTALVAYACSSADMSTASAAMAAHCEGMPETQAEHAPTLCTAHCAQQPVTPQNVQAPSVPPLVMPALLPAPLTAMAVLPVASVGGADDPTGPPPGLPPELRFQRLLI